MRFPLAVLRRAKELVGDSFPITMRISGVEFVPGGRKIEETVRIATMLEAAGLAGLHITAAVGPDKEWAVDPIMAEQGRKVYMAAAVKAAVRIPVITVGVIREPAFAESVIAEGKADFVAVGRGLLADPDWPNKARDGRAGAIRKCFSCNYCDGVKNTAGQGIRCVVNEELGLGDPHWEARPAPVKKKVMVVGGGPAGIEAARVAALRGHDVTLFEKRPSLGGQLVIGAKVPGKEKIAWCLDDLLAGLAETKVQVRCGAEVTPETIAALAPDAVVLATGGEALIPGIPGADGPNVVTAWSLIDRGPSHPAKSYVVVGGSSTGCETALMLARDPDVNVTLVEMLPELAPDMEPFARGVVLRELEEAPNIDVELGCKVTQITRSGAAAVKANGAPAEFDGDLVVLAVGVRPSTALLDRLAGAPAAEVWTIGDCTTPGTIAAAVIDGRILGGNL
jgi:NADPH-dependent 2,4-dienoyl-CoA reductase/sulfur reductase-like enzyme